MSNGYFSIPRSLTRDPLWINLPPAYKEVFLVILDHVVFKTTKFDDHGHLIELQPGEICISIREILKLCGKHISKNDVERSINKLILYDFLRQEVRHRKSILKISHPETYELILRGSETKSEPNLRQTRDKLETQSNNVNNENNENKSIYGEKILHLSEIPQAVNQDFESPHNINNQTPPVKKPPKPKKESKPIEDKIKVREFVLLTQKEYDTLIQNHGNDLCNAMLDALDSYNTSRQEHYASDYGALKKGGWVYEKAVKQLENKKIDRKFPEVVDKVELLEKRKSYANNFIKKNWDKFSVEKRPRTMPEFVWFENEKLNFLDEKWDILFPHYMQKSFKYNKDNAL